MRLVSVHIVHPYCSIDTTAAWKKLCFILSLKSNSYLLLSIYLLSLYVSRYQFTFVNMRIFLSYFVSWSHSLFYTHTYTHVKLIIICLVFFLLFGRGDKSISFNIFQPQFFLLFFFFPLLYFGSWITYFSFTGEIKGGEKGTQKVISVELIHLGIEPARMHDASLKEKLIKTKLAHIKCFMAMNKHPSPTFILKVVPS